MQEYDLPSYVTGIFDGMKGELLDLGDQYKVEASQIHALFSVLS